jgi:ribosome biogenesis GTPase
MLRGLVVKTQSGFVTVQVEQEQYVCELRGRLKKGPRKGDVVAVGDWVLLQPLGPGRGRVEEVEERQRLFTRLAPDPKGAYRQILIANPDQVLLVFACAQPAPRLGMLDRFLVTTEKQRLPAVVVANKADLVAPQAGEEYFGRYRLLGYPLIFTSALSGQGVAAVKELLVGKITLLTGPSGAGKSSLLNLIQPGLGLAVRQVSQATSKGRHTTVVRELIPLQEGGYVADTPGLKALALSDVEPEELDAYFPELRQRVAHCQFSDCTHVHEPGCAVLQALEDGEIHPERYQSYLNMRYGQV